MTENERRKYEDELYSYDFDSAWDVEKALREPKTPKTSRVERSKEHREEYYKLSDDAYTEPIMDERAVRPANNASRTRRRKNTAPKTNIRGWLILIGMGLVALLILIGFIWLIVAAVSPDSADADRQTPSVSESADDFGNDVPLSPAMQLIAQADAVAAGYDYDGAVNVLRQFGDSWESNAELAAARDRYMQTKDSLISWKDTDEIPHLAFHSLIVDPARAFRSENGAAINRNMITVKEFRAILQELYSKGYVLVRIHDVTRYGLDEDGDETYLPGNIYLPEGKTPLIISQDDVNYYEYMVDGDGDKYPDAGGAGFASRLVLDENGELACEYYDASGALQTGAYDLVPILEEFIREHPDFSYKGARAVLSVTGYQGVFGYRTSMEWEAILGQEAYAKEIRAAQDVAKALKEHGWELASHGYGHYSYSAMSAEEIASDVKKWENQVQPIVGDSDVMMFPYGCDIENEDTYSGEEYRSLYAAGYRIFCGFHSAGKWVQFDEDYFRMSRIPITGEALKSKADELSELFDAALLYDSSRPPMLSAIGFE